MNRNRFSPAVLLASVVGTCSNAFAAVRGAGQSLAIAGAVGLTTLSMSLPAEAGIYADAITDELTEARTEIGLIAIVVLGLVGFLLFLSMSKRAAKG